MRSPSVCALQPLRMLFPLFRLELTPGGDDAGVKDTGTARPRVDVDAPSMEAFKARLDGALHSLIWWVAALPVAGS